MIGIDIIEISRISQMNKKNKLAERILSSNEIEYLNKKSKISVNGRQSEYDCTLAGYWASKEAVLKMLGKGLNSGIELNEIQILHKPTGQPYVSLSSQICHKCGIIDASNVSISISHDAGIAVAIAKLG